MDNKIIKDRKAIVMAITETGEIGPKMFQQMLMRLGAPEDFLNASDEDLNEIPLMTEDMAESILQAPEKIDEFNTRIEFYQNSGINIATFLDTDYPLAFRELSDPPPVIYHKGEYANIDLNYVAIVGTTNPSQPGIRLAVDLAKGIVDKGYAVVSGLAAGIDSAAHLGVLKVGGITTAVLGCGIENIYPPENEPLAENIINSGGLLISEVPPDKDVTKPGLITRNRLIAALSKAVIVAQIGEKSQGELITAKFANKQAKPLFYGNPENDLDNDKIKDFPGVIINDTEAVGEILKYIV